MRIATFGDYHLGPTRSLDKFQGQEECLLRFADHLERTHDFVVLLGDIFQTDYGKLPGSRADVLEATLARYPRITARWMQDPYSMVFGNHDLVTRDTLEATEELRFEVDGWRIWMTHGHQFDPLIGGGATPYRGTWAMGWLRRARLHPVVDFLEGPFFVAGQRLAKRWGGLDIAEANELHADTSDVVVMGHSHRVACTGLANGVYANSGAGTPNRMSYVSIDTERRTVEVCVFQPGGAARSLHRWRGTERLLPTRAPSLSAGGLWLH